VGDGEVQIEYQLLQNTVCGEHALLPYKLVVVADNRRCGPCGSRFSENRESI